MTEQFLILTVSWRPVLIDVAILTGAIAAALLAHYLLFALIPRLTKTEDRFTVSTLVKEISRPTQLLLVLIAISTVLPSLAVTGWLQLPFNHILEISYIVALSWLAMGIANTVNGLVKHRLGGDLNDNVRARRTRTKVSLFRRIVNGLILFFAVAAVLMTFPHVRTIGTTLFASAGLAGLALGMAARPTLGNLIAGIQVALTEPVRLGDVVVVEKEWGRVTEVNTTYVVVLLWDLRHLVVPLSYFIEQPFQNWTRNTSELIGSVMLYLDYTVPVDRLREEFDRILQSTSLWDGKTKAVQVTEAREHTLEIRFLLSAPNASMLFDLRCLARERLVVFLQKHYPEALPRFRSELTLTDSLKEKTAYSERLSLRNP